MKNERYPAFAFWVLISAAASVCYTFWFILEAPGHVMTELGGDAVKNYFTYLYHIEFGKGVWFTGMNYPFGEHITYTDAQPALSVPLSYLHQVFPFPPQVSLAVMHMLIALSYVLAYLYLYKILRHFGLPGFYALLFSAGILFLSPQLPRALGHFGLSYACYLPMIFYWTVLYRDTGKIRYLVWFTAAGIFMMFLHPYFAATACIWAAFYCGAVLWVRRADIRPAFRHIIPFLAAAAVIVATLQVFVKLTDPVRDRPAYPYDILNSFTTGDQVFTSSTSPFWQFVSEAGIYATEEYNPEKNTYPGLPALIIVLVSFAGYLATLFQKKENKAAVRPAHFDPVWLIMAAGVLLFTMGVPVLWGGNWLIDYLAPLRQFRSVGRFVWIFYYLITVYAAVIFYKWYAARKQASPLPAHVLMIAVLCLWALDAIACINKFRRETAPAGDKYEMYFSVHEENWPQFLETRGRKKEEFQGLLLLPFIHIGSEKIWLGAGRSWLITLGTKAALQLQLPVVDVMLSRTSWSQTWDQVKISAGPYAAKPLLQHIRDNRPFLLLEYHEDSLAQDERYLLESADLIGVTSQCNVYAFYPGRLRKADSTRAAEASYIASRMRPASDTMIHHDRGTVYINHLDNGGNPGDTSFFGNGYAGRTEDAVLPVAIIDMQPQADSVLHEFSAWVLVARKDYRTPYFEIELKDSAGNLLSRKAIRGDESVDNEGLWLRAAGYFQVPASCRKIICNLHNPHGNSYLAVDELMLRPDGTLIISRDGTGRTMVNNHVLKN